MAQRSGVDLKEWNRSKSKASPPFRIFRGLIVLVVILGLLFYGVGGWYFSDKLYTLALSGKARRDLTPTYNITVTKVTPVSITLAVNPNSPPQESHSGTWGIGWSGGYGDITTILSESPTSITRTFTLITGADPKVGQKADVSGYAYPDNPKVAFGINYQKVDYNGPLGKYPSWFIPGQNFTDRGQCRCFPH